MWKIKNALTVSEFRPSQYIKCCHMSLTEQSCFHCHCSCWPRGHLVRCHLWHNQAWPGDLPPGRSQCYDTWSLHLAIWKVLTRRNEIRLIFPAKWSPEIFLSRRNKKNKSKMTFNFSLWSPENCESWSKNSPRHMSKVQFGYSSHRLFLMIQT